MKSVTKRIRLLITKSAMYPVGPTPNTSRIAAPMRDPMRNAAARTN